MQGGYGYDASGYGYGYDASGYGYGYDDGAGGYSSAAGAYYSNGYPSAAPVAAGAERRAAQDFPAPLNGLEFQPSETCPKNYVIFDQTCTKSRVVFHPSLANRLGGSSSSGCYGYGAGKDVDGGSCSVQQQQQPPPQEEDAEGIDALLSSEDGGDDDDVVSTGRAPGHGSSPDSTCSSASGGGGGGGKPRKKDRVKKMMRTLKGIIPGGSQMGTPAVLDEAVRYLKSLKVEAKKLGVRGSDS